jgi:DNA-binding HxlR family transcriptional regulator
MSERHQLGDATLELAADLCMLAVLDELSRGPMRASEIERCAPGIPRWTALRRLRTLARNGYAGPVPERDTRSPRRGRAGGIRARYELTDLGRECLLEVPAAAVHWEQRWCSPPPEQPGPAGLWALKLVRDRHTRGLVRALADAPLRPTELEVRLPELGRSALLDRLRSLTGCGVLLREEHPGEVRYALADSARHLSLIVVRAARCEGQRASPADRALIGDLPGLLHLLAPLARIPQDVSGICRVHIDGAVLEADISLAAAKGGIAALGTAPTATPHAVSHGTPRDWCEALLHNDPSKIVTSDDAKLVRAVLDGLSTALTE